jgi:hypothetical protein
MCCIRRRATAVAAQPAQKTTPLLPIPKRNTSKAGFATEPEPQRPSAKPRAPGATSSNLSKMNTYAKFPTNPSGMNTYKKMGGGEELLLPNTHPRSELDVVLVECFGLAAPAPPPRRGAN